MTAARRPRSAALLVGSTSGTSANVQSAGQSLSRFFASARTCRCRLPVEPHSSSGNICILIAATCRCSAARSPSCWNCFQAWKTFQLTSSPVEPERLLRSEAEVGVEGEVAAQMRPADLPPFRLEAVVSAEAIGANNAGELVADQPVQVLLDTVRRDPQHRRLFAEGAPERARLAAQVPAGLVDVERRRCTGPLEQLVVDQRQRLGGAAEDRVDRPDCDRAAK